MKIEKVEFYAEFLSFKIMLYKHATEVSLFLTILILKSFNKKTQKTLRQKPAYAKFQNNFETI